MYSLPTTSQDIAQVLKAGGDPLRLEILKVLETDSYGVLELSRVFNTKQSGMSHHLKILSGAGMVSTRREGNSIFYRRNTIDHNDILHAPKTAILQSLFNLTLPSQVLKELKDVHNTREKTSQDFFNHHAQGFKEKQDLIATFEVYGKPMADILEKIQFPATQKALEVGPGEGEFLTTLSKKFNYVIALDNAQAMLEKSKQTSKNNTLNNIDENIEFVLNDTSYCQQLKNSVDCTVINMVLHHVPSPNQMFIDIASALKPGGSLILSELCQHNQDWAKSACGDLWLGFEPKELSAWAKNAGLINGLESYFALRNGFQIQIRQFIKKVDKKGNSSYV